MDYLQELVTELKIDCDYEHPDFLRAITLDKMTFVRAVSIGDTICVYGNVIHIGNFAMDIKLEVWAKVLIEEFEKQRHLVTEAVFRYVAIGEDRRTRRIPDNP